MTTRICRRIDDRSGYSLVEVIATLVMMAVLLSLATPVMTRMLNAYRTQTAVSQLANDLALTRSLAVQNGRSASLRRTGSSVYAITVDTSSISTAIADQKLVRTVNLARDLGSVAIAPADLVVTFDSRGFARTGDAVITITRPGGVVETLRVEALGRIRREN